MRVQMKIISLIKLVVVISSVFTSQVNADGKIIGINFSGPDDPNHINIVQFQIEGGFASAGCNVQFAAIRNTEDRQHLISFALAAFASKEPVVVVLNGGDKYFADRCTISRISSVY